MECARMAGQRRAAHNLKMISEGRGDYYGHITPSLEHAHRLTHHNRLPMCRNHSGVGFALTRRNVAI